MTGGVVVARWLAKRNVAGSILTNATKIARSVGALFSDTTFGDEDGIPVCTWYAGRGAQGPDSNRKSICKKGECSVIPTRSVAAQSAVSTVA